MSQQNAQSLAAQLFESGKAAVQAVRENPIGRAVGAVFDNATVQHGTQELASALFRGMRLFSTAGAVKTSSRTRPSRRRARSKRPSASRSGLRE